MGTLAGIRHSETSRAVHMERRGLGRGSHYNKLGDWKIRTALAVILMATAPVFAAGPCSTTQFSIENLKVEVKSKCDNNACPRLVFAGRLKNNCPSPASAKIRFVVYDKASTPIEIIEDWTTAPQNLAPGGEYPFVRKTSNKYSPEMTSYITEIVETRTW